MSPATLVQADDGRLGTLLTVDRTLDIATVRVWTAHPLFTPEGGPDSYLTTIRVSNLTPVQTGPASQLEYLSTGRYLPATTTIGA